MLPNPQNEECPHCGYHNATASVMPNALKPGSKLHERYVVGKVLDSNGEGITYLAYDTNIGCKVAVREYLPVQLCERVKDSCLVNVDYNHLAQYKSLMAEYTELNKSLARQRSLVHLNPALDLFAANNTTYAVYEFIEGRNLLDYLKENAGELSWRTVSRMFPPLFTTLSILHNAGVLHRGISPETIFVTDKGDIKLTNFCISAVRTNDSELDDELYEGYAAPEQYFANRQQGTWTDVYGICAVLYRILTGCRATDANTRQNYDNIIPPHDLNPHVPKNVSDGIMKGLALDSNQRIRTITDLVTILFESGDAEDTAPAVTPTPRKAVAATPASPKKSASSASGVQATKKVPVKSSASQSAAKKNPQKKPRPQKQSVTVVEQENSMVTLMDKIRVSILIAILVLVIFAIVLIAFKEQFPSNKNQTLPNYADTTTNATNIIPVGTDDSTQPTRYDSVMPNLVGMNFRVKKSQMAGWLDLEPVYEYNDEYDKDIIFDQDLKEGDGFMSGSTVQVKVSLGSSKKNIPDFEGFQLQAYLGKLHEMGFVEAVEDVQKKKKSTTTTTTTSGTGEGSNLDQKVIYRARKDSTYKKGFVCGVDPGVGSAIDLQKDYTIIVYYVQGSDSSTTKSTSTTSGTSTTTTKSGTGSGTGSSASGSTKTTPSGTSGSSTSASTQSTTPEPPATSPSTAPPTTSASTAPPPPPPPPADNGNGDAPET